MSVVCLLRALATVERDVSVTPATPKIVLDACVIYPMVLRSLLLGYARRGGFAPLWSARILEEYARATHREGPEAGAAAQSQIALMQAEFPAAMVTGWEDLEVQLVLPDPADTHVLAAAMTAGAPLLMTRNLKDFPSRVLSRHGVTRIDPDGFLRAEWSPCGTLDQVIDRLRAQTPTEMRDRDGFRRLLKKSGLPRLAKAWATQQELSADRKGRVL